MPSESRILDSVSTGVVITDADGIIVDVNHAHSIISGYDRSEVIGCNPRIMKSDRHDPEFFRAMWRSLVATGRWVGEVWDRRKNGEVYPKWLSIDAMRDAQGRTTHFVGVFFDISEAKRNEADLERLVHHDPLTGLPNRILFKDRLDQAMGQARRSGRKVAVLFFDLDRFKQVNDSLGHAAGDRLLAAVGDRLVLSLRSSDTIARLGGDEFIVLLPSIASSTEAIPAARKVVDVLQAPFSISGRDVSVSASVGISIFPDDGEQADDVIACADQAMYWSKEGGRDRYRFYSRAMHERAVARQEMEASLRRAIEKEEMVLHFQPQVDLANGLMVGVEALVRWKRPGKGLVPPLRFIPIAEEAGLMAGLGGWVLREACRQARAWRDLGLAPIRMAVNVAASQMEDPRLICTIASHLIEFGVEPESLELEITESSAMRNPELTIERLQEAKAIGMRTSIDDFGTGYSSLAYLQRFTVDALKIDRSFLHDLPRDHGNSALMGTMIGLAHNLGMEVIAEGVETHAQLEFLREHRCDMVQGYLFSQPLSADRLAEILRSRAPLLPRSTARGFPATTGKR